MSTPTPRRLVALLSLGTLLLVAGYLAGPLRGGLPREESRGYGEDEHPGATWVGRASWYGPGLHGQFTASGEPFDMHALTAAHRTLPLGTRLRLINPETRRSVVVKVNDRGPFVGDRELDVSYEAARRLGFRGDGVAVLTIQLFKVPPRSPSDKQQAD